MLAEIYLLKLEAAVRAAKEAATVRCEHHRLDLGAKALPRHEMIDFERIAPR